MKIAIGSDHAGYILKEKIKEHLLAKNYEVLDVGTSDGATSVDYPVYGEAAARLVASDEATYGVVCCGSAIGISIAANKVKGIRCGIAYNDEVARLMREHNNANMIAFGEREMGVEDCLRRLDIFLSTSFSGGRHARRVEELDKIS